MKLNKLMLLLVFFLLANTINAKLVKISLIYDGEFSLGDTKVTEGNLPGEIKGGYGYTYEYYSIDGLVLRQGKIVIPGDLRIHKDYETEVNNDTKYITLFIEYNPKLKNLVIRDKETNMMLDVDLMQYNSCNLNNICDENEDKVNCPEDCYDSLKDGICQNIEDGTCEEDPDCNNKDPDCIIEEYHVSIESEDIEEKEDTPPTDYIEKPSIKRKNQLGAKISLLLVILIVISLIFIIIYKRKNRK